MGEGFLVESFDMLHSPWAISGEYKGQSGRGIRKSGCSKLLEAVRRVLNTYMRCQNQSDWPQAPDPKYRTASRLESSTALMTIVLNTRINERLAFTEYGGTISTLVMD